MNDYNIVYRYPNNLAEKFMVFLWTPIEMGIVAIAVLLAGLLAINTRNIFWMTPAAALAILLAHLEDQSIWQVLLSKLKFITGVRVWEYTPGIRHAEVTLQQKDLDATKKEKKRRKAKNNILSLIALAMIIAIIAAAMFVK
ncbi:MAG: hypothetical protein PUF17_07270 [Lactimicrobium massiliense]|nr:hypothetical protein [Lactimicrobium massiliense]MDD6560755.1 hypothetical protein [Lactimicrobium massiliense]